jgi:hypothetical protein
VHENKLEIQIMKQSIFAIALLIAMGSCQSKKQEESSKADQSATTETVTTEDAFFAPNGRIVTAASYPTDETSRQILKSQSQVGVNKFIHKRQLTPTDNQPVVRMNRDTYYSMAVVDVSKGASITMPEIPEGKYISVQPVTEDHRIQPMMYGPGTFELKTHSGTHVYVIIRLDATFTESEVKEIQDKMSIEANSDRLFETGPVNKQSFIEVEDALKAAMPSIVKRDGVNALEGMFTAPGDESSQFFTQEKYQVGAAVGWGGAQMIDNIYELSGNYSADGCYQMTFEDPKNMAFWSITVYDENGFMFNDLANYSSNTAEANEDGTYTLSFGCGEDAPNNLEIANPSNVFNIAVRHYQPSKRVLEDDYRLVPLLKEVGKQ